MNRLKHFYLFLPLILFLPLFAQNRFVIDVDVEIPKKLERKFKRDAARLALRMEAPYNELSKHKVAISSKRIDSLFNLLKNIYAKNETAKTIAKCKIHTFPNPSIDHFKLIFRNDVDWASSLQNDVSEISNETLNELLDDYDLIIERHEKWTSEEDVIIIRALQPMNMAAIAKKFEAVDGVESIDFGIPEIKGNDITVERKGNAWIFSYILVVGGGFGQESSNHVWTFKVSDEGNVRLLNEVGPPIPEWLKCESPVFSSRI